MTITELCNLVGGQIITDTASADVSAEVKCGLTCDLLSWVMAKGAAGCAWVTVQTHMNVIAVAALHDMACVVLSEDVAMDDVVIKKAESEGIAVIRTPLCAFEICGRMYKNGIPSSQE